MRVTFIICALLLTAKQISLAKRRLWHVLKASVTVLSRGVFPTRSVPRLKQSNVVWRAVREKLVNNLSQLPREKREKARADRGLHLVDINSTQRGKNETSARLSYKKITLYTQLKQTSTLQNTYNVQPRSDLYYHLCNWAADHVEEVAFVIARTVDSVYAYSVRILIISFFVCCRMSN